MSTRNRIIYQSEALFVSNHTGSQANGGLLATEVTQLQRVTEISNSAEITRQDVNVFGKLASLSREILEEPTVSLDFTYYTASAFNESGIGLTTYKVVNDTVSCLSGILANDPEAQKNYYILTVPPGKDANTRTASSGDGLIGLGNCFLTNYTLEASVGEIPTCSVSVEASNITYQTLTGNVFTNPAIDITQSVPVQYAGEVSLPVADEQDNTELGLFVVRPGDIQISFGTGKYSMGGALLPGRTTDLQTAHIQSFSLEIPLSRTPQRRIGNAFSFSKELDVPINVTLNVTANLADIEEGSLVDLICADAEERNITIKMFKRCENDDAELNTVFTLAGASMDSQNTSSTIGDAKTVELTFTTQIGGPEDTQKGLFISGVHSIP